MNSRIDAKFRELKKNRRKALIVFMTAGDPSLGQNERLVLAFEKEGVDLIELGAPFSDPLADGQVIQASSQRSLKKKINIKKILSLVKKIRLKSNIPIILMSYLNPISHFGLNRFAGEASQAGVDGVIIPDLPPEEGREIETAFKKKRLDLIYLLAPTSTLSRIRRAARSSKGFLYYVSVTGVTGARRALPRSITSHLKLIKKNVSLPVCVGFGVSTPAQARAVSRSADGVIIGSAVVSELARHPDWQADRFAQKFIRPFSRVVHP